PVRVRADRAPEARPARSSPNSTSEGDRSMTDVKFETREIGSLAKPPWRVKAFAGRPIEEGDVAEAERWAQKLGLEGEEELVETLRKDELGKDDLRLVDDWSARYGLALLERAGLDVVYDGEQRRTEMYDHVIRHARGFEQRGTIRSFDNKYYSKAAVVEAPSIDGAYDVDEYRFLAARTDRRLKAPFTGPYTVVDWSYDEHYGRHGALGATAEQRADARRRFLLDVAEHVVRPNAAAVVEAGCDWIQIDEPALSTRPDEVPIGVEAFNASVAGIPAQRRSLHICFSDYTKLFPHVLSLDDCFELQLEFATATRTSSAPTAPTGPATRRSSSSPTTRTRRTSASACSTSTRTSSSRRSSCATVSSTRRSS